MNGGHPFDEVLIRLRQSLARMRRSQIWQEIVEPRDEVIARFQPLFDRAHLPHLTEAELRPFFYFENNHHWTGLYRQVNRICSDMPALRRALLVLTDETRPVQARLDEMGSAIFGMKQGIITAILSIAFPGRYGVWNGITVTSLKDLRIWPQFEWGSSFGERYVTLNALLRRLAADLEIDLWTLDALWWQLEQEKREGRLPGVEAAA